MSMLVPFSVFVQSPEDECGAYSHNIVYIPCDNLISLTKLLLWFPANKYAILNRKKPNNYKSNIYNTPFLDKDEAQSHSPY